MKRIIEEKSINSDIVNLSDLIADKILKQAPLKQTQISKINGALFVEGEFINLMQKKPLIFCCFATMTESHPVNGMNYINLDTQYTF